MSGIGFVELDVLDGNGETKEARLKFRNVLFVPDLTINLLSTYELVKEGFHITASLIASPALVSQDDGGGGAATLSDLDTKTTLRERIEAKTALFDYQLESCARSPTTTTTTAAAPSSRAPIATKQATAAPDPRLRSAPERPQTTPGPAVRRRARARRSRVSRARALRPRDPAQRLAVAASGSAGCGEGAARGRCWRWRPTTRCGAARRAGNSRNYGGSIATTRSPPPLLSPSLAPAPAPTPTLLPPSSPILAPAQTPPPFLALGLMPRGGRAG